jgi:hypothetical protein
MTVFEHMGSASTRWLYPLRCALSSSSDAPARALHQLFRIGPNAQPSEVFAPTTAVLASAAKPSQL